MSVCFSSQCKENVEKAEDHFSCETLTFTFEQVYFWCNLCLLDIKDDFQSVLRSLGT